MYHFSSSRVQEEKMDRREILVHRVPKDHQVLQDLLDWMERRVTKWAAMDISFKLEASRHSLSQINARHDLLKGLML